MNSEPRIFLVLVDDSHEMEVALRYASLRARAVGGHVAMLYVTEPMGVQLWQAVEERVEMDARREAEARLLTLGEFVHALSGQPAIFYMREGNAREALLNLLEEDHYLSVLVLAAAKGQQGPGTMVNFLSGRGLARLRVPLVIVPEDYVEGRAQSLKD